mmetsp:Transcript_100488/g.181338  ORF Transcript_100488/g.181338 Transcript_100488/m.181338 type:complete len:201 (-) Transcript_100488:104-706(-)
MPGVQSWMRDSGSSFGASAFFGISASKLSLSSGSSANSRGVESSPSSPSLYRKFFTSLILDVQSLTPTLSSILFKARLITKGRYDSMTLLKSSSMKSCTMRGLNTTSMQKVVCLAPSARAFSFRKEPMSKGTCRQAMPCFRIHSLLTVTPEYAVGISHILCFVMFTNHMVGGLPMLSDCRQKPTLGRSAGLGAAISDKQV